jgi:hypothetical protein
MKQAVYALDAFLASVHVLSEDLGLFARAEEELTEPEARRRRAHGPATEWCLDMLDVVGWEVGELEDFTDQISAEVAGRARGLIGTLGPKDTEAFYLSACALVIDAFCARVTGSEIVCAGSPIEILRHSVGESLKHDYEVDLSVNTPTQDRILAPARDLVGAWRVWASEPV